MGNWFHRVGAILGSALAVVPVLGLIPGIGTVPAVLSTVLGVGITLVTNIEKVLGKQPQ